MKFSVSTWIYGNQNIEEIFRTLKDLGFDGMELKGEPDEYSIEKMKELSLKYGIEIISIAGIYPWPTNERDLSSSNWEIRGKAIDYLRKCCIFAKKLKASIVIVSPTPVGKVFPDGDVSDEKDWKKAVERDWKMAVSSLREASIQARDADVFLAIEPLNRYETYLINNVSQAMKFIEEVNCSHVKLHLDTFHMNIEEGNLVEAIKVGKTQLVNIHIADSNRQAVGRGHIDFENLIKTLLDVKYKGPLTLEPLPAISNPYFAVKNDSYRPVFNEYLGESLRKLKAFGF